MVSTLFGGPLADQLNLHGHVANIQELCNREIDIRPCYFREIVLRFIQSQSVESCDNTRRKIVPVLEKLHYVNEASQLSRLKLESPPNDPSDDDSSNVIPSTISDKAAATKRRINILEKQDFPDLVTNTINDMEENKVKLIDLQVSVVNLPGDLKSELKYFGKEISDGVIAAKYVKDVILYISHYWNFLDYHLLEYLINRHGTEKLKEEMRKYAEKIKVFRRETQSKIFSKIRKRIAMEVGELRKMVTVHDMDCATTTLEDIENFRIDINSELSLSNVALLIYSVTDESVEVTWLVPESLVAHILKSINPSSPSMRNHNVTKLTIDVE